MSLMVRECLGGPLDGEKRPVPQKIGARMRERCEYAKEHPDHPFPWAVYVFVENGEFGPHWQFSDMEA